MHLAGVNAAGRHRHQLVEARPILIEEHAVFEPHRIEVLAANVVVAARRGWISFELANYGAGMDVIDPGETHPFCDHPERNRSEEHTSELQSRQYLVCRLLLEK